MRHAVWLVCVALLFHTASTALAHPVPGNTHDRTLVVRLQPAPAAGRLTLRVEYRLEVDELTASTRDLEPYAADFDVLKFRGRSEALYGEMARRLAPDLAFRLSAKANGQPLDFAELPASTRVALHDAQGTPLGHLRCDFAFAASFPVLAERDNTVLFYDQSYLGEAGKLDLSFDNAAGVHILQLVVPTAELKARPLVERQPGDDERLRTLQIRFRPTATPAPPVEPSPAAAQPSSPPPATEPLPASDEHSLLRLVLHTDYGFWLTMLMACVFGAAHALTPGHGKTLVAAYLVGERGTTLHALVLGIVTTLTHTGVVLLLAIVLVCLPNAARERFRLAIADGLGLAMGLLVTCMGFWLLLQRLSGHADHFHFAGGHHHGPGPPAAPPTAASPVRWGGLVVLGITGGLVPCWDAIYLLFYAVGSSQLMLALPAVLAFSAGLAGVLVLIGVLVVQVPNFARSRWGRGRLTRALPLLSAVVVTLMGLWLCYEGAHGR